MDTNKHRRITLWISNGFINGGNISETIEVPNDITDEELDKLAKEFMFENIEYGWYDK